MAQLKFSLKTNTIKAMFFDIFSNVSRYYYAYGRALPWETVTMTDTQNQTVVVSSEENPPAISDTYSYELDVRKDILYTKAISSSDACIVARRLNWQPGLVYDMYDDYSADNVALSGATSLDQANFYVLTSDFNVYKCLFNNNGGRSTDQPNGTSIEPVVYSDGYIWKFMYTIPLYLRNKFMSASYMPCTTALTNQFYSNGSITSYSIENKGFKYPSNTWKVKRIIITSGGANYNINDIDLTFPNPETGSDVATAQVIEVGAYGNIMKIEVTNQGSGYTSQPIPVITHTTGSGFLYTIEYSYGSDAYTVLKVTGDGYNEENPYSLKNVTIKNAGIFYGVSAPSGSLFTFPPADLPYGFSPEVDVQFEHHPSYTVDVPSWRVKSITVTNSGYGYSNPIEFGINAFSVLTQNDSGFLCDFNTKTQKNEAELIPLINASGEIEAISIKNQGQGYTYATIEAIAYKKLNPANPNSPVLQYSANAADGDSYVEGWVKAALQLNFGIGDIETKQSNVELLAVDGAIPVIVVEVSGLGYNQADTVVTIDGDGVGATAVAVVDTNSSIKRISVTNEGQGYTYAHITISGAGNGATARAILSPKGGHGKDAVGELYAHTLMLVNRIGSEKTQGLSLTTDYRQITILKNPKMYGSDNFFKKSSGTSCALLTSDITTNNTTAFNAYNQYDVLVLSNDASKQYTLVEKYTDGNKYYMLVQLNNNYLPSPGSTLFKASIDYTTGVVTTSTTSDAISISSVTAPDINKYSGEMLYIDNRSKFASTDEQTIVTTTLISF